MDNNNDNFFAFFDTARKVPLMFKDKFTRTNKPYIFRILFIITNMPQHFPRIMRFMMMNRPRNF